ncbi:MAG: transketolase [Acidobacteriota bacterium]
MSTSEPNSRIDDLCITTIRTLSIDGVQKANSGHPGMPMGAAPMAYTLWMRHLRFNPEQPQWPNRDRFVLSAGHGSMLLYSLLHLTGYDLSIDDLKHFRQFESRTPGHPEYGMTGGIETTTGPLGQGFANGVGMAIAQKYLAARYNRPGYALFDYMIYAIVSDGDLMEGISHEAASLAGHLKLGNIVYLYDDNGISIDGKTTMSFTDDTRRRFEGYGWDVHVVADGNDIAAINQAIAEAKAVTDKPSIICVKTHIGFGSPNKQDTSDSHGSPLGTEEVALTKKAYGWDPEKSFFIPDEVKKQFGTAIENGKCLERDWQSLFDRYAKEYPDLAREYADVRAGNFGTAWIDALPVFTSENGTMATREASGKVLAAIAPHLPTMIGGSADLTPSNNTRIKEFQDFQPSNYGGRYIRFGVREHGMGSLMNGIALTSGMIPYGGTFLIFSEYMRPAIRMAAIMGIRPIYVFTHDSIGLGEDGPTHQPVEQLASLRSIPNITVIRPADASETVEAWRAALTHRTGPVALALTRQKLPFIDRSVYAPAEGVRRGAYVLAQTSETPELILIGTGSELQFALGAYEALKKEGASVRVVSMPSWELFEAQTKEYRDSVLPPMVKKRLAIEAGSPMGWHKYVGDAGEVIGMQGFGLSGPYQALYEHFGFTTANVLARAKSILG